MGEDLKHRLVSAGLRIERSVIHFGDPRHDDRAGAHDAGLERHEERRVLEAPGAVMGSGLRDGQYLRMRRRILEHLALVVSLCDDSTARKVDDDRSHGNFVCF
jgi:hypothetical protein